MDSLPSIGGGGNPPQKPSSVGKFFGRAVSYTGQAIKVVSMPVWILFVPTRKLVQMELMNQTCERPLLDVFRHRGSDTEDVRKKRGQAALSAMEAVGRDLNKAERYWGNPGLVMRTVEDLMGLSRGTEYDKRSGCTDQQRIANIHYWILTIERDVDTSSMTRNQALGFQVMQGIIKNTVEEFHGRNLNALAQAYQEKHGASPNRADMAKLLVENCLVRKGGRREQPAHLGYDFEEIKKDKMSYDRGLGRFGNAILRDYYMAAPPKGLGLNEAQAKAKHKEDYYEDEGPYDPTFWDGSEGRTLVDLMKHVSFEEMKDYMANELDGNPDHLFDLRFPLTTPGVKTPPRPFDYDSDDDDYSDYSDTDDDYDYDDDYSIVAGDVLHPAHRQPTTHGVDEFVQVDDVGLDPSLFPQETIAQQRDHLEKEEDLEDPFQEKEVVISRNFEQEVRGQRNQLPEEKLAHKRELNVASGAGGLQETYSVYPDFEPQLFQEDVQHVKTGQILQAPDLNQEDSLHSSSLSIGAKSTSPQQYQVEDPKHRRPAPQRGVLSSNDAGNMGQSASERIDVLFFNPGIIELLSGLNMSVNDRELLAKAGAEEKLVELFEANPQMSVAEKENVINQMLDGIKSPMTVEDALAHYCGLAPAGDAKDIDELAGRALFSNLIPGGSHGDTIAGVLHQKALQLRQGKLNESERLFIESLLQANGKSLEDFKTFTPEKIFDYFRKEDLPRLLAFTSGKEVAILGENNGKFEATTYAVHGSNLIVGQNAPVDGLNNGNRIVLLLDDTGNYQVLKPIEA